MSETYAQCPRCNYKLAAPLPTTEACPACGIYPFKWEHHLAVPSHEPATESSIGTRWDATDPMDKIKMGARLAFLGGFISLGSLASGAVFSERDGFLLSRANAPIPFWLLVFGALALGIFGAYLAVVPLIKDRDDADVAALGIDGPKIFQYLGLFCVMAVIYSIYLKGLITPGEAPSALMQSIASFCLISASPFAMLACSRQAWHSTDAAHVSVVAWGAVYYAFSLKYGRECPVAAVLLFAPFVLTALLGHTLGAICRRLFSALAPQS
jgi:hypothetical protein